MSELAAPSFNLTGRVAFVTGASKGIGLAIARGLAEQGARVVISSRRLEAVTAAAEPLQREGLEVTALSCHVGKADDIDQAIEETD